MARASASTRAFGATALEAAEKNSAGFTALGLAAGAAGAALFAGLGAAAKAAMDFESSFAGVRKTVDASEAEFQALAQGMRDLATEIPVNVNELNRIGEAAGQLGIHKSAILGFTEVVAKLGVTTNLAGDLAASTLARIANITQMSQGDFDRLGATIVHLGNNLATTEAEITDFGLRIAGAGKIAGLTEANILAIGGALSSVGVQAEAGGTSVQKVLIGITDAVATGSDKLELLAQTAGMSADRFVQAWADNPAKVFVRFVEGLAAAGDQGTRILRELFGGNERLFRSFLSLAGAGDILRDSIGMANTAWEENNALNEEAARRFETTEMKIQLAKNRITDAAISLGNVLLPAIAAVVDVVGSMAQFFADLPAPIQAVVAVVGGLAGALLLVGGAALLILPRVAAAKAALLDLGLTGGIVSGSLRGLAGFLTGPLGLALTLASLGLVAFANAQAQRREAIAGATAAIQADTEATGMNTDELVGNTSAVLDNSRAWAANAAEAGGLLEKWAELGVEGSVVVDAILGSKDAMDELQAAVSAFESRDIAQFGDVIDKSAQDAMRATGDLASIFDEAAGAADRTTEAVGETGDAADGTTGAMGELGDELGETASEADQLKDALDALAGSTIDAEKAAIAWRDSIRRMREDLEEGSATLQGHSAEADANRTAILGAVDAAIAHGVAVAEETGSLEAGAAAVQRHIGQLINEAVAAGASEQQVRAYIRQLNLTPKDIKTLISLLSDQAMADAAALDAALDNAAQDRHVTIFVHQSGLISTGGGGQLHAGGVAGETSARRLHGGGMAMPNLRGNEVMTVLERGETVRTGHQERELQRALAQARLARTTIIAAPVGQPSLRGLRIAGVLETPFGPAEVRGVVQEEMDADDRFRRRLARMR